MNPILKNLQNANPLTNQSGNPAIQMYKAYKMSRDPELINKAVQSNPMLASLVNQNVNMEQAFYELCRQRGVNPEEILKNFR